MELIEAFAPAESGRIIDVGGGASVLVDRLLRRAWARIAVLDISEAALTKSRARLGDRSDRVEWIAADITAVEDLGGFDVWHDRAVFHFLTDPDDRRKYAELARRTLPIGGHLIVATFADDGPTRCSGLDVRRYNAETMSAELGEGFSLVEQARETHATPSGSAQAFVYGAFQRC
jgi:SAM-dependent methyltransferase